MAHCSPNFVSYLPAGWRDLSQLDKQILDDFSSNKESLSKFFDRMGYGGLPDHFITEHSALCRGLVELLSAEEKKQYSSEIEKIREVANDHIVSLPYKSAYHWLVLPEKWHPYQQEDAMIERIETSAEECRKFVEGLMEDETASVATVYPRLALSAIAMRYRFEKKNPQFLQRYDAVIQATRGLIGEPNAILVKHGCTRGMSCTVGWLLEDDPKEEVEKISQRLEQIDLALTEARSVEGLEGLIREKNDLFSRLKVLAQPFRASAESGVRRFGQPINPALVVPKSRIHGPLWDFCRRKSVS